MKQFNYELLHKKFNEIVEKYHLYEEPIQVEAKSLTPVEAIGNPERRDYPILKGKEKLMQAEFKGGKGQAFTDMPGYYTGSIRDILDLKLITNFERAVFIAAFNAVISYLGLCGNTVHCKDEEPENCGEKLVTYVKANFGTPKIAMIGLQPALLNHLAPHYDIRVLDMDADAIGKEKYGVLIENSEEQIDEVLAWCDLILATGSTVTNGTINYFMGSKPVVFYGTTIAATAALFGLERFCPCSHTV